MPRLSKFGLAISATLLFFAAQDRGQDKPAPAQAPVTAAYPDSPEGLRQMLIHVLAVARSPDAASQLPALVKDMEIPDYRSWAVSALGKKRGKPWTKIYAEDLASEEKLLAGRFVFWAGEDGDFFVWKVGHDSNSPGGRDESYSQSAVQPLDAFYAEWRRSLHSTNEDADPVGYFLFIDGKFRWDKAVQPVALSRGNTGNQPSCSYCPPPQFPPSRLKEGGFATVSLRLIVQPDGHGTDIQVVKSGGSDFDEQAVKIVKTWIFHPALGPDGNPTSTSTVVEVQFRAF